MKSFNRIFISLILVLAILLNLASCMLENSGSIGGTEQGGSTNEQAEFYIKGDNTLYMNVGESLALELVIPEDAEGEVEWTSSHSCVSVQGGVVTANDQGIAVVKAMLGDYVDRVTINVVDSGSSSNPDTPEIPDTPDTPEDPETPEKPEIPENPEAPDEEPEEEYVFGSEYDTITVSEALVLAQSYSSSASSKKYYLVATVTSIASSSKGNIYISDETGEIYAYGSTLNNGMSPTDVAVGDVVLIYGPLRNYKGTLEIEKGTIIAYYTPGVDIPTPPESNIPTGDDPYENVDKDEFYENYKPATSYEDAYYRTQNGLMSGTIADQDQAPTISAYQPKQNGKFVRNTEMLYSEDGNTYYVVDAYGEVVMEIYRGAAYIMLEEVAAHVFAFGEPPANQSSSKNTKPTSSIWGIYLRVNHTAFSGSTSSYPYEPELPNISGCGGTLNYYEMDIGTTGTDCDPSYEAEIYNNGSTITRGAARIVYVCEDDDGNGVIDHDERYVFYTYNHYNDFQEYLNYYGGWGEMFGNITGGGTISSKYDYNPTDYVETTLAPITKSKAITVSAIYYWIGKETLLAA